jgi:hypothetical protein
VNTCAGLDISLGPSIERGPAGTSVREMDPYFLRTKFPDIAQKFPVLRNLFPDNLLRELREKSL